MSGADRELAVAYLLGELDAAERAHFERRLEGDAALRDEVAGLRGVVAELQGLPPQVWDAQELPALRIDPRGGTAQGGEPARRSWRDRLSPPRFALAGGLAAAALAAGIAGVIVVGGDDSDTAPELAAVDLRPLAGTTPQAAGAIEPASADVVELRVENLPSAPDGHHYELWLLSDGDPVPLERFTVGSSGEVVVDVPLNVDPTRFTAFDVSIERDGGDPSHSGESVLRGEVTGQSS